MENIFITEASAIKRIIIVMTMTQMSNLEYDELSLFKFFVSLNSQMNINVMVIITWQLILMDSQRHFF